VPYAADTKVPVERSRLEIERTLKRYGADRFAYFSETGRTIVMFEANAVSSSGCRSPPATRAAMSS
jgi:hypothetical protein